MISRVAARREWRSRGRTRSCVLQDPLHHLAKPFRFSLQQLTVALHAIPGDDAMREVFRGGANHRHRRAQLVRDTGDEFHLLARETMRAA